MIDISIPSELDMYSQDANLPKLKVQLKMVPDLIRAFNAAHPDRSVKEVTTLRMFSDILNAMPSTKVMFDEVARLLQIVLTIPITTATAERTFSASTSKNQYVTTSPESRNNLHRNSLEFYIYY